MDRIAESINGSRTPLRWNINLLPAKLRVINNFSSPLLLALALIIALALAGCGEDSSKGGNSGGGTSGGDTSGGSTIDFTGANNYAMLSGVALGYGTASNDSLRKQIAVTVMGTNTDFAVGTAYSTKYSVSSNTAYIVLPITNISTTSYCFVELVDIVFRDSIGQEINFNFTVGFVVGSVGALVAGTTNTVIVTTNTCLAPNETGYDLEIQLFSYGDISSMEFSFEVASSIPNNPEAKIISSSYAITEEGNFDDLTVTVGNQGSVTGDIESGFHFHHYILFDGTDLPLGWGFLDSESTTPVVPPGATTSITDISFAYEGTATKVFANVDFEDEYESTATTTIRRLWHSPRPSLQDFSSSAEWQQALLTDWKERESAKKQIFFESPR